MLEKASKQSICYCIAGGAPKAASGNLFLPIPVPGPGIHKTPAIFLLITIQIMPFL